MFESPCPCAQLCAVSPNLMVMFLGLQCFMACFVVQFWFLRLSCSVQQDVSRAAGLGGCYVGDLGHLTGLRLTAIAPGKNSSAAELFLN